MGMRLRSSTKITTLEAKTKRILKIKKFERIKWQQSILLD